MATLDSSPGKGGPVNELSLESASAFSLNKHRLNWDSDDGLKTENRGQKTEVRGQNDS